MATLDQIIDHLSGESITETIQPQITATTGSVVSSSIYRHGHNAIITLTVTKTSQTGSGSNIFVGKLTNADYLPAVATTNATFFNAMPIIGAIGSDGAITIRNATTTSLAANANVLLTIPYIIN